MSGTNWSGQDSKQYVGRLDRIFVSMSESWERSYFVDHYLTSHGFSVNEANRKVINDEMEKFPGRAPIQRTELTAFLEQRISKK